MRRNYPFLILSILFISSISYQFVQAEDFTQLGGDLSTDNSGRFALQLPAPNVTDQAKRTLMIRGFTDFHMAFSAEQGLGPKFVNNACRGCHVENGRGPANFKGSLMEFSALVLKISLPGVQADGSPRPLPKSGGILKGHSVSGKKINQLSLKWRIRTYVNDDGSTYTLRKPSVGFSIKDKVNPKKIDKSLRMSPAIIGVGLIEAIPEETILALSDPYDLNGDGISGRPNYVWNKREQGVSIGRFGYKAANPTVEAQTLGALVNEMGITSDLFGDGSGNPPEFSSEALTRILAYQKLAGVPKARNQSDPDVQARFGKFKELGCDSCHTPTLQTGPSSDAELAFQTIHPFSDFLLHDMGSGLADRRPEFEANGKEWRTTPLWGSGDFAHDPDFAEPLYLHDGRARNIEEAILWHGGEALEAKKRYKAMSAEDKARLIKFLSSL